MEKTEDNDLEGYKNTQKFGESDKLISTCVSGH